MCEINENIDPIKNTPPSKFKIPAVKANPCLGFSPLLTIWMIPETNEPIPPIHKSTTPIIKFIPALFYVKSSILWVVTTCAIAPIAVDKYIMNPTLASVEKIPPIKCIFVFFQLSYFFAQ